MVRHVYTVVYIREPLRSHTKIALVHHADVTGRYLLGGQKGLGIIQQYLCIRGVQVYINSLVKCSLLLCIKYGTW